MKVFLDSNVLVSAFATRGLSADVFRLVVTEHELLTGEVVLEEVERVLRAKFLLPPSDVQEILALLRDYAVEPKPPAPTQVHIADPDDAWVLASAIAAGADLMITGDRALLEIDAEVTELQIISPREFWELHRGPRS